MRYLHGIRGAEGPAITDNDGVGRDARIAAHSQDRTAQQKGDGTMRILMTDTTWTMAILAHALRDAGFFVTEAADAHEIREFAASAQQDAILIDPDLPDEDYATLVRHLRAQDRHIPILMFSRKVTREEKLRAMALGADDFIEWPSEGCADLPSRLRAMVRRAAGYSSSEVRIGDLYLDLDRQTVRCLDMPLRLTRLEYELMETMALRGGALITRDEIMLQLYAWDNEPDAKIIDVYICRLRAKIAAAGATHDVIVTSFAQGYRLNTTPTETLPQAA